MGYKLTHLVHLVKTLKIPLQKMLCKSSPNKMTIISRELLNCPNAIITLNDRNIGSQLRLTPNIIKLMLGNNIIIKLVTWLCLGHLSPAI